MMFGQLKLFYKSIPIRLLIWLKIQFSNQFLINCFYSKEAKLKKNLSLSYSELLEIAIHYNLNLKKKELRSVKKIVF